MNVSRRRTIPGLLASSPHRPGVLLRRYDTTNRQSSLADLHSADDLNEASSRMHSTVYVEVVVWSRSRRPLRSPIS
ncbi:hypothetical protein MICRO116_410006 [Micrococcus sp. 116]|nr:hypothetical protein MICRO116_410006 [Micrococcus sp. 116]